MRELSYDEYRSTFDQAMSRAGPDAVPPFDFWPYVESRPASAYRGFDCSGGRVDHVYTNSERTYSHVLIDSDDKNVFMVIVLDLRANAVYGHRLLNLNELYGLSSPYP